VRPKLAIGLLLMGFAFLFDGISDGSSAVAAPPEQVAEAADRAIVTGRVTDQNGNAIAGATVEWGRNDRPFQARQRVKTDKDGKYLLTLKSLDGRCHIAASAPGYLPEPGMVGFGPGRHTRDFELAKMPADKNLVTGVVVDERGKPIEGVRVEAFTPVTGFYSSFSMPTGRDYFPGPDRVATTDKEGRFRIENLPTDEVQLNVRSKYRHVNDENYPVRENLRITMTGSGERGVIQGRIVEAATGEPPADLASVRIVRRHSSEIYECSHEDGRFQLPVEVTLGAKYPVYVYAKLFAPGNALLKAVPVGSNEYPTIELTEGPLLRGKLVDAETGQPIARARVLYGVAGKLSYFSWSDFDRYADGYHSLQVVQHDKTNKRGGFWFAEPAERGMQGLIFVLVDGYQRWILRPDAREFDKATGELVIRLPRESAISGVVMKDGKPLANARVSVGKTENDGFQNMYEGVPADADGRFRYGRLAAGKYWLNGGPYARRVTVGAGKTVTVNVGGDLGPIVIHGKAAPSISINVEAQFEWEYSRFTTEANAAGEYELRGLKPGKYRVTQHFAYPTAFIEHATVEIEVTDDADQRIDLMATPDFNAAPQPAIPIEVLRNR
jgi:protocatechuate 3,4-dioxygenase beta subunit